MDEEELVSIAAWADQYAGLDRPSEDGRAGAPMVTVPRHVYGQLLEMAQEGVPALVAEARRLRARTS